MAIEMVPMLDEKLDARWAELHAQVAPAPRDFSVSLVACYLLSIERLRCRGEYCLAREPEAWRKADALWSQYWDLLAYPRSWRHELLRYICNWRRYEQLQQDLDELYRFLLGPGYQGVEVEYCIPNPGKATRVHSLARAQYEAFRDIIMDQVCTDGRGENFPR